MLPTRLLCAAAVFALAGCASAPRPGAGADPLQGLLAERGGLGAPAAAAPRDPAAQIVLAALNFLDHPYAWGGNGAEGFDCSGFTRHVVALAAGVRLPRTAHEQAHAPGLAAVAADALQPGDLVFFNTLRRAYSHVGLYLGGGRFVHAPRAGAQVRVEDMRSAYWAPRFDGARRVAVAASDDRVAGRAVLAPADDRP